MFKELVQYQVQSVGKKGIFVEMVGLINACLLEYEFTEFKGQLKSSKGSSGIENIHITFSKSKKAELVIKDSEIALTVSYEFKKHENCELAMLSLNLS